MMDTPCRECGKPTWIAMITGDRSCAPGLCIPCYERARRKLQRARQAAARARFCNVCGASFRPKRADAVTCSAACRQKSYRKRQQDRVAAVDNFLALE
jgi:hypothetical protein